MAHEVIEIDLKASTLDELEAEAFGSGPGAARRDLGDGSGDLTVDGDSVIGTFKRWSASAVECYVREAHCEGCYYQNFFKDKPYSCKMNLAVEQLLDTLGEPSKNLLNKYG